LTVGILTMELFFAGSGSLKDKRQLVKPLVERLRRRFNVAVAEVDGLDTWQRSTLAVATVGTRQSRVAETLAGILRFVEAQDLGQVTASHIDFC